MVQLFGLAHARLGDGVPWRMLSAALLAYKPKAAHKAATMKCTASMHAIVPCKGLLTGGRCRPQRPWGSISLPPYQEL